MLSYDKTKPLISFVVPTGIGATIGGFAGDASQYARMFAKDFNVIVNPNVVNAACFSETNKNNTLLDHVLQKCYVFTILYLLIEKYTSMFIVVSYLSIQTFLFD